MTDYLDELSALVAGLDLSQVEPATVEHTALTLTDVLGAVLAGGAWGKEIEPLASMIATSPGRSSVLIKGFPKAESSQAALINGAAGT